MRDPELGRRFDERLSELARIELLQGVEPAAERRRALYASFGAEGESWVEQARRAYAAMTAAGGFVASVADALSAELDIRENAELYAAVGGFDPEEITRGLGSWWSPSAMWFDSPAVSGRRRRAGAPSITRRPASGTPSPTRRATTRMRPGFARSRPKSQRLLAWRANRLPQMATVERTRAASDAAGACGRSGSRPSAEQQIPDDRAHRCAGTLRIRQPRKATMTGGEKGWLEPAEPPSGTMISIWMTIQLADEPGDDRYSGAIGSRQKPLPRS